MVSGWRTTAITGERTKGKNGDEQKHESNKTRGESGRRKLVRFITWFCCVVRALTTSDVSGRDRYAPPNHCRCTGSSGQTSCRHTLCSKSWIPSRQCHRSLGICFYVLRRSVNSNGRPKTMPVQGAQLDQSCRCRYSACQKTSFVPRHLAI